MARINIEDMFQGTLLVLGIITLISITITRLFPAVPSLKSGIGFMIIAVVIFMIAIFTYARNGFRKEEIINLLLIAALLGLSVYFLKYFFPQIFSTIDPSNIFGGIK